MTSVNTNSNPNFWQKFKAGFSKNWKNGNIANWTTKVGQAAFGIGFTGMVIHDLNKNNNSCSIFGNRCCGGGFSGFGMNNCFGMNSWNSGGIPYGMMADPMGYSWMPQNSMGTDPYLMQYGNMLAAQAGARDAAKFMAQMNLFQNSQTQQISSLNIPKRDNETADKVADDTDTTAGEAFDKATNQLKKDGKVNEDADDVVISKDHSDEKDYITNLSNLSKSYMASIDTSGDGYISESEFIKHEIKNSGATEEKDKAKQKLAKVSCVTLIGTLIIFEILANVNRI